MAAAVLHGGKSLRAPLGNSNAYKTDCHTAEMKALKAAVRDIYSGEYERLK